MVYTYGKPDLLRKVSLIKSKLRTDGFYSDRILCRVSTTSGASGIFNRGVKNVVYTDTIVSGIMNTNPTFVIENNIVETSDGTAQFTCKKTDMDTLLNATEIWYEWTLASGVITGGRQFKVKSNNDELFDIDRIFILKQVGETSA